MAVKKNMSVKLFEIRDASTDCRDMREGEKKRTNKTLTPDHSRVIHLGQSCMLHGSNVGGLFESRQASSGSWFLFCLVFGEWIGLDFERNRMTSQQHQSEM